MEVDIHPSTNNPSKAWQEILPTQTPMRLKVSLPSAPVGKDKVRFVCMSDTHSLTSHIKFDIPDGDVFLHAGDFTRCGQLEEVVEFNEWIGKLPHKYKIVIAGNHELSFDKYFTHPLKSMVSILDEIPTLGMQKERIKCAITTANVKDYLTNCTYLEDSGMEIYGVKVYGTPWQPEFCKWAFNLPRGSACLEKWNRIPLDTDVLITHTPPVGYGDLCCNNIRAGCVELLSVVQKRLKAKYHVFGHVHEGYGVYTDGKNIFINAATCDLNYLPNNPPVVFDVKMPAGATKD